jgi:hypothetical protein
MTDDLVKRLRDNCTCNFPDTPCGAEEECRNAFEGADRIEKLEAALRFYACDCKPERKCGLEYYIGVTYCGHTARKALEGKDG